MTGIAIHIVNQDEHSAMVANPLGIWIAAGLEHASPDVQQAMIGPILADDQIPIRIIRTIAVYVMNFRAFWQRLAQRLLRNTDVNQRTSALNVDFAVILRRYRSILQVVTEDISLRLAFHPAALLRAEWRDRRESTAAAETERCRIWVSHVERPPVARVWLGARQVSITPSRSVYFSRLESSCVGA